MASSGYYSSRAADYLKPYGSGSFTPNKMAFGWDDALLGAGTALSGLFGAIGGSNQAATQAKIAKAQLQAQNAAMLEARGIQKGNLGLGLFNTIYGSTTAPDIEFGRQLAGQRAQYAEFLPKQMGLGREAERWQAAFRTSPDVIEANRRERFGRMQETIAPGLAQATAMFGPTNRVNLRSLVG